MRKFKQRPVIYPRLCQAPPQGQLGTAAAFHFPLLTDRLALGSIAPTHTLQKLPVTLSTLFPPLPSLESAPVFLKKLHRAHAPKVPTPHTSTFVESQMTDGTESSRILPKTTELMSNKSGKKSQLSRTPNASTSRTSHPLRTHLSMTVSHTYPLHTLLQLFLETHSNPLRLAQGSPSPTHDPISGPPAPFDLPSTTVGLP